MSQMPLNLYESQATALVWRHRRKCNMTAARGTDLELCIMGEFLGRVLMHAPLSVTLALRHPPGCVGIHKCPLARLLALHRHHLFEH